MLKLIYKNLLARRGRYSWIFLELCLVAIISWTVLDQVIVNRVYSSIPLGYDIDRLAVFNLATYPDAFKDYEGLDKKEKGEKTMAEISRILDRVRSDSRVEAATMIGSQSFCSGNISMSSIPSEKEQEDGVYIVTHFWPGTDFFRTFGIKDAYDPSADSYKEIPMSGRELIVSKSIADYMFPGESGVGHFLEEKKKDSNPEKYSRIVGVVAEANYRPDMCRTPIVYKTRKPKDISVNSTKIVIRLKPGVDPGKFVEDYNSVVVSDLKSDNIYSHSLSTFKQLYDNRARDGRNQNFIGSSIAAFFFVNILLCMVGTFYLQTRKRAGETGVMRSFGATRGSILREMLGEGFVMVTLAWIFGCAIFWLYMHFVGVESSGDSFTAHVYQSETIRNMMPLWVDDKVTHFAGVSLIIYVIMLISVLLGIYIPARKISRINPVDALRYE